MKNRKIIAIGCVLFALALGVLFLRFRLRDPIYEGRRLSDWVASLGFNGGGLIQQGSEMPPDPRIERRPSDPKALEAISKAGMDAFPLLASMLGSKEWPFEPWMQSMAAKHAFIRKFVRPANLVFARQVGAVAAFCHLGPQGSSALPKIIPLLRDPECALPAMYAVMYIHPEKEEEVLSLTNVLSIQKAPRAGSASILHSTAILILGKFGAKAAGAAPILTSCLASTNEMVRAAAAIASARIGSPPERAISLMITNLPKTNFPSFNPRNPQFIDLMLGNLSVQMTVWALGQCGAPAHPALPILSNIQHYPLGNLAEEARVAAARIRGETNYGSEFLRDGGLSKSLD